MAKAMCITEKRIHRVRNIDPSNAKARSISNVDSYGDRSAGSAKSSFKNRRFTNSKKSQILQSQTLNSPKTTFWGSAVDIEI